LVNPSEEQLRQIALMKKMLLRKGMASEARERLARVRVANPGLAEQAEAVSIQLIQQGRQIDEATLKKILTRLTPKREIRIKRW
jgi:programmed cell death protein 5